MQYCLKVLDDFTYLTKLGTYQIGKFIEWHNLCFSF